MLLGATIFILLCFTGRVISAPTSDLTGAIFKRQSVSILTTAQIAAFRPLTYFASAAYCQPAATLLWNCGGRCFDCMHRRISTKYITAAKCLANPDFIPTASGGNGSTVQFCESPAYLLSLGLRNFETGYVGYSPSEASVIVAHQGTDTEEM